MILSSYPWKALISPMIFLAKPILAEVFSLTLSLHFLNSFKYLTIFLGPNIYKKTPSYAASVCASVPIYKAAQLIHF